MSCKQLAGGQKISGIQLIDTKAQLIIPVKSIMSCSVVLDVKRKLCHEVEWNK